MSRERFARLTCVWFAAACAVLATAPVAMAAPSRGEIHAVFWSVETDEQSLADDFFRCLTEGSSFSGSWSSQFGIPTVVYDGSAVLPGTTPTTLSMPALAQLLIRAFEMGQLPAPISGVANEYISFTPSTSIVGGLCTGPKAGCGEHDWHSSYKGVSFDYASVPLGKCDCHNMWDSESKKTTEVAGHETGEGLARLGGAGFEVGDACEAFKENLTCCGTSYQIQQLAGSRGATSCQPINSTASDSACVADAGPDASSDSPVSTSSGASSSGSGSSSGGPSGSSSSGSSSSGSSSSGSGSSSSSSSGAGSSSSGSSSGGSSGGGAGSGYGASSSGSGSSADAGSAAEQEGGALGSPGAPAASSAGCGCKTIGDRSTGGERARWSLFASIAGLAVVLARRRRRPKAS